MYFLLIDILKAEKNDSRLVSKAVYRVFIPFIFLYGRWILMRKLDGILLGYILYFDDFAYGTFTTKVLNGD